MAEIKLSWRQERILGVLNTRDRILTTDRVWGIGNHQSKRSLVKRGLALIRQWDEVSSDTASSEYCPPEIWTVEITPLGRDVFFAHNRRKKSANDRPDPPTHNSTD